MKKNKNRWKLHILLYPSWLFELRWKLVFQLEWYYSISWYYLNGCDSCHEDLGIAWVHVLVWHDSPPQLAQQCELVFAFDVGKGVDYDVTRRCKWRIQERDVASSSFWCDGYGKWEAMHSDVLWDLGVGSTKCGYGLMPPSVGDSWREQSVHRRNNVRAHGHRLRNVPREPVGVQRCPIDQTRGWWLWHQVLYLHAPSWYRR